jgi:hypothetical protein
MHRGKTHQAATLGNWPLGKSNREHLEKTSGKSTPRHKMGISLTESEYVRWEPRYSVPDYVFGKEPNYFPC